MRRIYLPAFVLILGVGFFFPTISTEAANITISGNVSATGAGAILSYSVDGSTQTVTPNGIGDYSIVVPFNWSGTVEPSLAGYTFQPPTRVYTNLTVDQASQNYIPHGVVHTDFYVNNINQSCSDSGAGTISVPFCTIAKAARVAIAGNTVHILAGAYAETVRPNFGNQDAPVTFLASPGVLVTGEAGNSTNGGGFRITKKHDIVIDGFTIMNTDDYGIYSFGSTRLTIRNNHVSEAGNRSLSISRVGIYFDHTTYSIISGNTVFHNSYHGIQLFDNSSYNTVSGNISYGNAVESLSRATGIDVWNSDYNTIIHNILYANEDSGINFYSGSQHNSAIGNVSYGNGDHGIDNNSAPYNMIVGNTFQGNVTSGINMESSSSNAIIMNNILVDNGFRKQVGGGTLLTGKPGNLNVDSSSSAGLGLDYNLYDVNMSEAPLIVWGTTTFTSLAAFQSAQPAQEVHGLEADPCFNSPAPIAQQPISAPWNMAEYPGDYHLKTGSPAIDNANSNTPGEPVLDLDGNHRVDVAAVANNGTGTRKYDDRGAYEFQTDRFTLTVVSLNGSVTLNPDQSTYAYNEVVELTATPENGWTFMSWGGDVTGTSNPLSITIHRDTAVTANYAIRVMMPLILR